MNGLQLRDITFSYRRKGQGELAVQQHLTWHVPTGVTALLGINGAGKSTLLSIGATALMPKGGKVSLNELDSHASKPSFERAWHGCRSSIEQHQGSPCESRWRIPVG